MAIPDVLVSIAALAFILVGVSVGFAVCVVLKYVRDRDDLRITQRDTERALGRMRGRMATRQERIRRLQQEVADLGPLEERMHKYHETLVNLRIETERAELAGEIEDGDILDQERGPRQVHRDPD